MLSKSDYHLGVPNPLGPSYSTEGAVFELTERTILFFIESLLNDSQPGSRMGSLLDLMECVCLLN